MSRETRVLLLGLGLTSAVPVGAEPTGGPTGCTIEGQVDRKGATRGPLIVYVHGPGPAPQAATSASIGQRNKVFTEDAVVVAAGASVDFPNQDSVHHHLYSITPGHAFEFPEHPPGARPTRMFDEPGDVRVQCKIHADMETHVLAVPNAWWTTADKQGRYRLVGVAPGPRRVEAWSAWQTPEARDITCRPGETVTFSTTLRPRAPSAYPAGG